MFKHYQFKNRTFRLNFVVDLQRRETTYDLIFKNIRFSSTFGFPANYTHLLCLYVGIFNTYVNHGGFRNFKGSDEVNIFCYSSFPTSLKERLRNNLPNSHFYPSV